MRKLGLPPEKQRLLDLAWWLLPDSRKHLLTHFQMVGVLQFYGAIVPNCDFQRFSPISYRIYHLNPCPPSRWYPGDFMRW